MRTRAIAQAHPSLPVPKVASPTLAFSLFGSLAILVYLGILALSEEEGATPFLRLFHLDREMNFIVLFSSSLLLACGHFARSLERGLAPRNRLATLLACIFVFMALDESLKIHETAEKLVGIDWQILYLPIIGLAGLGWLAAASLLRKGPRLLWILGAAAWFVSQILEAAQWGWWLEDTRHLTHYELLMVSEESLEMAGSILLLLGLFHGLRAIGASAPADSSAEAC